MKTLLTHTAFQKKKSYAEVLAILATTINLDGQRIVIIKHLYLLFFVIDEVEDLIFYTQSIEPCWIDKYIKYFANETLPNGKLKEKTLQIKTTMYLLQNNKI